METREAVAARRIGALEVTDAHLRRLDEINPRINAVVETLHEQARASAKALDQRKDKTAALFGVPVTTKINTAQKGLATSNGIAAFNKPQDIGDAPVVHNLKNSGAVLIGRSNTPEFSFRWFTANPLFGVTYNPLNRSLTPGGSSGGAAAAVACGLGAVAHGNDLGGSLRYPAYCCGIATIRPSQGCIPAFTPGIPERPPLTQMMAVHGPLARSIADVRLGWEAMRRRSADDPLWVDAARPPVTRALKVGYCADPFGGGGNEEVRLALDAAAAYLQDAGAAVREVQPPEAEECAALWGELIFAEVRELMLPDIKQYASEPLLQALETAMGCFREITTMSDLLRALQRRFHLQRLWLRQFEEIDVLLLPVSLELPFALEQDFQAPDTLPAILQAQKPMYMTNLLGLPAAQVPVRSSSCGIALGVQLVGAMHSDLLCMQAAEWIEQRSGLPRQAVDAV